MDVSESVFNYLLLHNGYVAASIDWLD